MIFQVHIQPHPATYNRYIGIWTGLLRRCLAWTCSWQWLLLWVWQQWSTSNPVLFLWSTLWLSRLQLPRWELLHLHNWKENYFRVLIWGKFCWAGLQLKSYALGIDAFIESFSWIQGFLFCCNCPTSKGHWPLQTPDFQKNGHTMF